MAVNLSAFCEKLIDVIYIIDSKPEEELTDNLSKNIWDFYVKNSQNYKLFDQKVRLKNKLSEILSKYFNQLNNGMNFVDIFISGSTVNGFATLDSDIDLCFIVFDMNYEFDFCKNKKIKILSDVEEILDLNGSPIHDCQLIEARVPILRYIDTKSEIRVEINVNNEIGIRNTRLLYCYSKLDWRVVPICIAIKRWAKSTAIIASYNGFLSSYTIELMVIFYLQNCWPPILPCLQKTCSQMFSPGTEISAYKDLPDLSQLTPFCSSNRQTLSQVFVGFFEFYLKIFDFERHVASVRLGKILSKRSYNPYITDPNQWEYICIEEPFSRSNAGRTVYESDAYEMIIKGFQQMYDKFSEIIDCFCDLK